MTGQLPREHRPRDFGPLDSTAWQRRLRNLPLRALVAFTLRCSRRLEPLRAFARLRAEAYAAGADVPDQKWQDRATLTAAFTACDLALAANAHQAALFAAVFAADAGELDGTPAAAVADIRVLEMLPLGEPDTPGDPIRWDDPRLGPLWPGGEPEWSVAIEKACRELETQLAGQSNPTMSAPPGRADEATPPGPDLPKLSDDEVAALRAYYRLRKRNAAGELAAYAGEYVVSDGKTIFAHGPSLVDLFPHAEEVAAAAGVPEARRAHFFVAGPE